MTAELGTGMVRVLLVDPGTNVAHLTIACPTHARSVVERSGRNHRFRLSPISETHRRCDICVASHAKATVADWPLEPEYDL